MYINELLEKIGLTEYEAKLLLKHLLSEIEEESYQASQKMFDEIAKNNGYNSYTEYLQSSPYLVSELEDGDNMLILPE